MRKALIAVLIAGLTACLDSGGTDQIVIRHNLNFAEGWEAGASDFEVGRELDVNLVGEHRELQAPLDITKKGLYLAGTNISDDLFTYFKNYLCCVAPGSTLQVTLVLEFASAIHAGCTVGLGPNVWIKAGATPIEPEAVDVDGVWEFSQDKGDQSGAGLFAQLGDIRNSLTGCPSPGTWALKQTLRRTQSASIKINDDGGFWVFIGAESGFEGRHELYFTSLEVTLR